jgi:hypothetical protein
MEIELRLDINESSYLKCSLHLSDIPDPFVTKSPYSLQNKQYLPHSLLGGKDFAVFSK